MHASWYVSLFLAYFSAPVAIVSSILGQVQIPPKNKA